MTGQHRSRYANVTSTLALKDFKPGQLPAGAQGRWDPRVRWR